MYWLKTIMVSSILKHHVLCRIDLQMCAYIFAIIFLGGLFHWCIDSFRQESNVHLTVGERWGKEAEWGTYKGDRQVNMRKI